MVLETRRCAHRLWWQANVAKSRYVRAQATETTRAAGLMWTQSAQRRLILLGDSGLRIQQALGKEILMVLSRRPRVPLNELVFIDRWARG
jgi:hypothetical protein